MSSFYEGKEVLTMSNNVLRTLVPVVCLLLIATCVFAQNRKPQTESGQADPTSDEEINWQVISAGGTDGSSTSFVLKATVGQTTTGTGSSTNLGLGHGFWQEHGGGGCCGLYTGGITGNANCSADGKLTLSDIARIIDRSYISRVPLCCEASGNTNGDAECKITLSDITALIDAVFISKTPPAACMPECEM